MDILIINGAVGLMMFVFVVYIDRKVNDITQTMDDIVQEGVDARAKKGDKGR